MELLENYVYVISDLYLVQNSTAPPVRFIDDEIYIAKEVCGLGRLVQWDGPS